MGYIVVGGGPRTGTSLLQMILCQDESTNRYVHEARYLRRLVTAYERGLQEFDAFTKDYFLSRENLRRFHRGVIDGFFEVMRATNGGVENLVVKDPDLTPFFPALHDLVPAAKFVCTVRNPLDAVASLIRVGEKQRSAGIRSVMADRNVERLSEMFKAVYGPVVNSGKQELLEAVLFVRYEDVVLHADDIIRTLREFTGLCLEGIDPARGFDTGYVDIRDSTPEQEFWSSGLLGKSITSESIGKHKDVLTPAEIDTVTSVCSDFAAIFNYGTACTAQVSRED